MIIYIRYDAASLVIGDIVRLVEGDVVPADVVVLSLGMQHVESTPGRANDFELIVDSHLVTGESKPKRVTNHEIGSVDAVQHLYYGSRVLEGACLALVVQTGKQLLLAKLIKDGRWPPKGDITEEVMEDMKKRDEEGISLMSVI